MRWAPIGLHEARHTFASLMIAAGVNAKALSTYMGHASVSITFDHYGHLMLGNESEAFLARRRTVEGTKRASLKWSNHNAASKVDDAGV